MTRQCADEIVKAPLAKRALERLSLFIGPLVLAQRRNSGLTLFHAVPLIDVGQLTIRGLAPFRKGAMHLSEMVPAPDCDATAMQQWQPP